MSRQTKLSSACFIYTIYTRYIDIETGRRSDTAHHYIYNQDQNKNLKILVRHRVVRVIFEYVFCLLIVGIFTYHVFNYAEALAQSESNMLTIRLEEQRVLLSHS